MSSSIPNFMGVCSDDVAVTVNPNNYYALSRAIIIALKSYFVDDDVDRKRAHLLRYEEECRKSGVEFPIDHVRISKNRKFLIYTDSEDPNSRISTWELLISESDTQHKTPTAADFTDGSWETCHFKKARAGPTPTQVKADKEAAATAAARADEVSMAPVDLMDVMADSEDSRATENGVAEDECRRGSGGKTLVNLDGTEEPADPQLVLPTSIGAANTTTVLANAKTVPARGRKMPPQIKVDQKAKSEVATTAPGDHIDLVNESEDTRTAEKLDTGAVKNLQIEDESHQGRVPRIPTSSGNVDDLAGNGSEESAIAQLVLPTTSGPPITTSTMVANTITDVSVRDVFDLHGQELERNREERMASSAQTHQERLENNKQRAVVESGLLQLALQTRKPATAPNDAHSGQLSKHLAFNQQWGSLGTQPGVKTLDCPEPVVQVWREGSRNNYYPPGDFHMVAMGYKTDNGERTLVSVKIFNRKKNKEPIFKKFMAKHLIKTKEWEKLASDVKRYIHSHIGQYAVEP